MESKNAFFDRGGKMAGAQKKADRNTFRACEFGLWTLSFGLLFLLTVFAVSAAEKTPEGRIEGMVLDSETGKALSGASIYIREINSAVPAGRDGHFTVTGLKDGAYTLRTSLVGYAAQTITVTVPRTNLLTILLKSSPIMTEEIVTTARGRQTDRHDIPGSVEVIGAEEIKERVPVSVPEALSRKPGLTVSSDMPWSQRVVVRGLMKDQVILFVDGARVVTATETAAEFGTVAHGDIERIEALKGPISVLYGSGSTGGVINIITRKGQFSDSPQAKLSLNPTFESGAEGLGMYERAEWSSRRMYISLSQSNRDYASYRAADGLEIRNTQFRDRQTHVNLGLKLSPGHLLEIRRQDFKASDVGIPGARSFPKAGVARYPLTTRELTDLAWTWRNPVSWWRESRLNAYYQPIHRDVELIPGAVTTASGKRTTVEMIHPGAYHNVSGARWQNILEFGKHIVVAGVEGWQKDMESYRSKRVKVEMLDNAGNVTKTVQNVIEDLPLPNSSQRPAGVFAEDAFNMGEKLKVTLGGRFDIIHTENDLTYKQYAPMDSTVLWPARSDTDRSWSFVAGAVYDLTDKLGLNLTLARSFRAPTIEERYLYADLGGVLTVGNPLIDPEEGMFVEGGFTARINNLKFSGQTYLNSLNNMVTQEWGAFHDGRSAWVAVNAGEARLWGFETAADWAAGNHLLLSGDFALARGTDAKANRNLPFMPPPRGHFAARWNAGRGYWIEPLATFVARQEKIAEGERITPGYGTLDLSLGKTFRVGSGLSNDLALGVKNVGDKLYRDHLATSRGYEMYGLGRSVFVSLRINYE